jgi:hypothetical protein
LKNTTVPTLPYHVKTFCEGEFRKYLINKALVNESKKELEYVLEEGGNKGFDKIYVSGGEQIPEQQRIMERIEKITKGRGAMVAETSCTKVEDILFLLTPSELIIMEQYYWKGVTPETIESERGIGRKTQQRMKRKMLYLLANRWGMA